MIVMIVMGNQDLYMIRKIFNILKILWGLSTWGCNPWCWKNSSNDKGNASIVGGEDKSNNDSSPPVHVDIPENQVQNMNVDQLKENPMKRKNLCMVQKILT